MELQGLYKTLRLRKRPEDVAEKILELFGDQLDQRETNIIMKAAQGSLKKSFWQYTSMGQSFFNPVGAQAQVDKAIEIFKLDEALEIDGNDHEAVEQFIKKVSLSIHKEFGENNFQWNRHNRISRKELGLDISKRRYNKLFRHLIRLEKKLDRFRASTQISEFQQIAKHGIVHRLTYEQFASSQWTAAFIAYYTSRCNLRSEFTIWGQQRPFDKICELLFHKAIESSDDNYMTIAYVYPAPRVLEHLNESQKGELLGIWTAVLGELAELLSKLWQENDINKKTMIVKKGNDSSSWNLAAGAWNKARDAWVNLNYALGTDFVLDSICFGKVMRLMAADLVYWHHAVGNTLDPNTSVWNSLPLPWQVFKGEATCYRQKVIRACQKVGLDPESSGWVAPRTHSVVEFRPTPELVHGVSISNPFLAKILKKHKYFSGKDTVKPIQTQNN